tara:strand:- start:96 stop:419 length:324 start_codon:yes stop_codon:yes gene_type:complete
MKYSKIYLILILLLLLNSCGTIKEGFSNQKKNNSDEFLVEKKSPLVMPPDFDKLPLPKNDKGQDESDNDIIKDLVLDTKEDQSQNKEDDRKNNKNFESTILKKIKQN